MLWELARRFEVVTNIRAASVSREVGLMAVELEGPLDQIDAGVLWLQQNRLTVEPVEMDVIE